MKNLKKLGKVLSSNEQKNVYGGRNIVKCNGTHGTGGSGIPCNGNPGCPAGEGCFIDGPYVPGEPATAHCHCL
jgi:hypothetical protein